MFSKFLNLFTNSFPTSTFQEENPQNNSQITRVCDDCFLEILSYLDPKRDLKSILKLQLTNKHHYELINSDKAILRVWNNLIQNTHEKIEPGCEKPFLKFLSINQNIPITKLEDFLKILKNKKRRLYQRNYP